MHGSDVISESTDLLGMDQSPAKKARVSSNPELRLEHFVCKFDPAWDYKEIAEDLFNGPKCLVMLEKLSTNAHVHFQGETSLAERTFQNKRGELSKQHFIKKLNPGSRPVRAHHGKTDEIGFQYICKEDPVKNPPLYMKGFTMEDIHEMHRKSEEYREKMQMSVYEYVRDDPEIKRQDYMNPKKLFNDTFLQIYKNLREEDKKVTRHTQKDIARGLCDHVNADDGFILWCMENNKF